MITETEPDIVSKKKVNDDTIVQPHTTQDVLRFEQELKALTDVGPTS